MQALPAQFRDLERFVARWDRPDTTARYAVRVSSSMAEMQEFYAAMTASIPSIKAWLDGKEFAQYDASDKCLARLVFAACIVGQAVEVYRQPVVPDTDAVCLRVIEEPEPG